MELTGPMLPPNSLPNTAHDKSTDTLSSYLRWRAQGSILVGIAVCVLVSPALLSFSNSVVLQTNTPLFARQGQLKMLRAYFLAY